MRVFLFGIDGLTFRVLQPLLERGLLPNFQRLQDGGAHGLLRSTVPPLTPPAWMSISTGLSPAKHGIYDFWSYERGEHGPRPRLLTHRRGGKALWNVLSEVGRRVIVANVPLTYPPEPVNGIMLSGFTAPDTKAEVIYPPSLRKELLEAVPGYQIDLNPTATMDQLYDILTATLKMTLERTAMLRFLLEKPWDFFFIVFTGADRIQHKRWPEIMALHPQAVAYYKQLDEALGMVLESLRPEDMLMVVSDHGFQGARRLFHIQEYLYQQGLLKMKDQGAHWRAEFRYQAGELVRVILRAMKLRGFYFFILQRCYHSWFKALVERYTIPNVPELDWANTDAWLQSVSGDSGGYADILLHDRMTEEQISALITALEEIRDPETGKPLLAAIHREVAFGTGPFAPKERHIVLIAGENITLKAHTVVKNLWSTCKLNGIHHPDGVLYLYGAGIKKGVTIDSAHVYDVVPTILSFMGIPLPSALDGKIIAEAFEEPFPVSTTKSNGVVMQKLKKVATE